jgi:D-alanyl-D-alanine carboxypeptidase (penicillin-binding protein 5/6)
LTVSAAGNTIISVKITYMSQKTGVLTLNGAHVASDEAVTVNASSVTFGVGNTGTATNGQVRITAIEVVYSTGSASTPTDPEPTEPEPTEPEPTWMTFPADRQLTARQYFVFDCENGEFLTISGAEDERIYPASITKLFTAYVANQFLHPDKEITVNKALEYVYAGSSLADLKKGDVVTTRRLVEGMLLPSGNDAAYALAIAAKGSPKTFVDEMNRQAKILGMTGAHFANPDGIHQNDHYMTFRDLALLGMLALEDPVIMQFAGVATDTVAISGEEKEWKNTNELIHPESQYYCPYAVGLKTGQTPSAGSCLLSAFEYEGRTYIIGVFGCPDVEDRFADTLQLFNEVIS